MFPLSPFEFVRILGCRVSHLAEEALRSVNFLFPS